MSVNVDPQQGDVFLFQTDDDGDISVVGGIVEMRGSLETMAYLCLFGGNEDDDGSADNPLTWWGNLGENEQSRKYVSRTQNLLRGLPLSSANLNRISEAVKLDTKIFIDEGIATSVGIDLTIPALNKLCIVLTIIADDKENKIQFQMNWKRDIEANK